MAEPVPDLNSFHETGNLFPGEVEVVSVGPQTTVGEALRTMLAARFSQLPVVDDGEVRGIFSLQSLAQLVASEVDVKIHELPVSDVMEFVPSMTVRDSLHSLLPLLEQHEAVLVQSPLGLQAVATPSDALRYLYRVAKPFVLVGEIELSLRALIAASVPGVLLTKCIDNSIRKMYEKQEREVPTTLDAMSFEDLRSLVTSGRNWPYFEGTLGKNRALIASKLERIRTLRNDVFHFRSTLTAPDLQDLAAMRDWLRDKARVARPRTVEEVDG